MPILPTEIFSLSFALLFPLESPHVGPAPMHKKSRDNNEIDTKDQIFHTRESVTNRFRHSNG